MNKINIYCEIQRAVNTKNIILWKVIVTTP